MKRLTALSLLISSAFLLAQAAPARAAEPASSWELLRRILMIPGISGQEGKVMDFIRDNLPSGLRPQRDAKNNIWFTAGDGRPHLLFVAHADELGFTVAEVTSQGTIKLKGRGGFLPQAELRKIFRLAEDKGIPVQARNSRGGNDGSVFVTAGAVDIPLSWPGAYAHSFIEKIERRDLDALTSLIKALAEEFR